MICRGKIAGVTFHGEFSTLKKRLERERVPLDNQISSSLKDCTKIETDMV